MVRRLSWRRRAADGALRVLALLSAWAGVAALALLLARVVKAAWGWVDWQFVTSFPSRFPEQAGVLSALAGSLWLLALLVPLALPVGVGAAIYLEEYAGRGFLSRLVEVNIANLAGVPSIIYGLLGLAVFVRGLGLGRSVLAGALTMALLVLPVIIVSAREAVRSVPPSLREASFALGATRWQTVRYVVLPAALPGILTGAILAVSRALGEAAPLITIGALTFVAFLPAGPFDPFTVLPIQIFNWTSRPQSNFQHVAAAGIVVLLAVLLLANAGAIWLRNRYQGRGGW